MKNSWQNGEFDVFLHWISNQKTKEHFKTYWPKMNSLDCEMELNCLIN